PRCRPGVGMVGRGDDDGVDVLVLGVEQLAPVAVLRCLGKVLDRRGEIIRIDIAQGNDILAPQVVDVVAALGGDADEGEVEFLVRRLVRRAGEPQGDAGRQSSDEFTSIHSLLLIQKPKPRGESSNPEGLKPHLNSTSTLVSDTTGYLPDCS